MKTLQIFIISALIGVTMSIMMQFPFASSTSGFSTGFDARSPDLSNMSLVLYDKFEQTSPNSTKDLHLEFFDEKNKTLVKNVSFFVNATKDDTVLMHELFYTHTGFMTLQFSPGSDTGKWIINGTAEPVLGGMMSDNDILPIEMSAFTPGTYHFHIEVLALVYTNHIVDQTHPSTFDSWWSVDDKGNISKYENSTTVSKIKNASPLQQFKSGVVANDVTCKEGLQLVIKAEDHSPACVKLDAAYMLIKRGWAASESAYPGGDAQFVLHTNSTIMPAHLPRSSGLRIPYYEPSRVINYTGFDGVYNETFLYRGTQKDYVLKPGSTGIITFKLEAVASEQQGQDYPIPLPKSLNLTNYAVFYHEITSLEDLSKYPGVTFDGNGNSGFMACSTGPSSRSTCIGGPIGGTNHIEAFVTDHPGVDVLFEPPSEVLPLGMNATSQVVTMMITADSNAPRGTYLVQLPSGGLDSFLLTVGDRPYHE